MFDFDLFVLGNPLIGLVSCLCGGGVFVLALRPEFLSFHLFLVHFSLFPFFLFPALLDGLGLASFSYIPFSLCVVLSCVELCWVWMDGQCVCVCVENGFFVYIIPSVMWCVWIVGERRETPYPGRGGEGGGGGVRGGVLGCVAVVCM